MRPVDLRSGLTQHVQRENAFGLISPITKLALSAFLLIVIAVQAWQIKKGTLSQYQKFVAVALCGLELGVAMVSIGQVLRAPGVKSVGVFNPAVPFKDLLPPRLFEEIHNSKLSYSFKHGRRIGFFSSMNKPEPISFYENFHTCGFGLRLEVTTINGQHMGYALLLVFADKNKPILSRSAAKFWGVNVATLLKWEGRFLGAPNGFPKSVLSSIFDPSFKLLAMEPETIMVLDRVDDMPGQSLSSESPEITYSVLGSAILHLLKGGKCRVVQDISLGDEAWQFHLARQTPSEQDLEGPKKLVLRLKTPVVESADQGSSFL